VSPDELADAYWTYYRLKPSTERADRLKSDELFWAWEMAQELSQARPWDDGFESRWEERPERVAPAMDRLELIELLAERAPDADGALAYLGAGPVENYLENDPDIARVDEAARRSERFRIALTMAWFDRKLPPQDVARLRRFGGEG
jgi:hypothetical protein